MENLVSKDMEMEKQFVSNELGSNSHRKKITRLVSSVSPFSVSWAARLTAKIISQIYRIFINRVTLRASTFRTNIIRAH